MCSVYSRLYLGFSEQDLLVNSALQDQINLMCRDTSKLTR